MQICLHVNTKKCLIFMCTDHTTTSILGSSHHVLKLNIQRMQVNSSSNMLERLNSCACSSGTCRQGVFELAMLADHKLLLHFAMRCPMQLRKCARLKAVVYL